MKIVRPVAGPSLAQSPRVAPCLRAGWHPSGVRSYSLLAMLAGRRPGWFSKRVAGPQVEWNPERELCLRAGERAACFPGDCP